MTEPPEGELFLIAESERSAGLLPSQMLRAAVDLSLPSASLPGSASV
jgi:hypothetical protein